MTTLRLIPALALTAALAGCASGPKVQSQAAPEFRLDGHASYAITEMPTAAPGLDPGFFLRNGPVIRGRIAHAMEQRGLEADTEAGADLLLSVRGEVTERLTGSSGPRVGFGVSSSSVRSSGVGTSVGVSTASTPRTEREGTLTIELRDRAAGTLLWVGWVQGRPRSNTEERIAELVDTIMLQLPGAPGPEDDAAETGGEEN